MPDEVKKDTARQQTKTDGVQELSNLRFYGDEFVLNTVSGMFYRLTPTAGALLRSFQDMDDIELLVDHIQNTYNVSRIKAIRDVELFLNDLSALGIMDIPSPTLKQKTRGVE